MPSCYYLLFHGSPLCEGRPVYWYKLLDAKIVSGPTFHRQLDFTGDRAASFLSPYFAWIMLTDCLMSAKQTGFVFFRAYILLDLTNAMTGDSITWLLEQAMR